MYKFKRLSRQIVLGLLAIAVFVIVMVGYQQYLKLVQNNTFNRSTANSDVSIINYIDEPEWHLRLVNSQNSIPDHYKVDLTELKNGESVDSRIYPDLQDMFDNARANGVYPEVTSGYRATGKQQSLFEDKIEAYKAEGYSDSEAEELAGQWVAEPGKSEHQLGLAVDINADGSGESTNQEVYDWLSINAYKYGFILRYPSDKTDITGTSYEPWHYRYVGKEAAEEIDTSGICLEEYLNNK